jgi:hypothetical protein
MYYLGADDNRTGGGLRHGPSLPTQVLRIYIWKYNTSLFIVHALRLLDLTSSSNTSIDTEIYTLRQWSNVAVIIIFCLCFRKLETPQLPWTTQLTKESIAQRHGINPFHRGVIAKFGIYKEENRHINGLTGIELLLLEAKALNLAKVRCHLSGGNRVRGYADDITLAHICRRIKRQRRLAGQHPNLPLLRRKLPFQDVRN